MPDVIERVLHPVHQTEHRVQEAGHAEGTEQAHLGVADELHEAFGDLISLLSQWAQRVLEERPDLVLGAERLEDREGDGQQGHERQERRVHEPHGPKVEQPVA